jgi:hypothetical protein
LLFPLRVQMATRTRRKAFTEGQRRIFAISRSWTCAKCGDDKLYNTMAWDIDHVTPLADGGADDSDNMQLLCGNCHQDKSRRENIDRAAVKRAEPKERQPRRQRGNPDAQPVATKDELLTRLKEEQDRHSEACKHLIDQIHALGI